MSDEKLQFIRIGGPGLADAVYDLPKSPLGRQAPLRTASVRIVERGPVKSAVVMPESGSGMPFIASVSRSRG
jgi:hypothetical protein